MKESLIGCLVFCFLGLSGSITPVLGEEKVYTNSIGMEFILVPAGSFMMGCDETNERCDSDEIPQHKVTLTRSFYLGKYEVTQAQWAAVMGSNPSKFKGDANPVEMVSWNDVQTFIHKLNQMEGTNGYRLPTEAEWEYAARAGSTTAYSFGDDTHFLQLENYGGPCWHTNPVGQKQPNPWGFYDIHGNVWEWVADWRGDYTDSPKIDPKGPDSGEARVLRGGGWFARSRSCRSVTRNAGMPDGRGESGGFRLVFTPDKK